ncbi:metal binding domain of Ada-domain-containing protein [Exophiala viscosa]|uniref:metal binding domain of Ada-domain-containing protein n=1 Tax=Exophiala viscosa TaxID=2486360 RepID=UPI00219BBE0D|nr:metal binding domain of Ada-domain-containing protein [Exophiala viscosa]
MSSQPFSTPEARWTAVRTRDSSAVGSFIYAVKTTGVYCRPDCKARLARRANVAFYEDIPQAEEAGFRACKRCKPNAPPDYDREPVLAKIREAVNHVREGAARGEKVTLKELSSRVGLSKWHLQRVFTKINRMSPRAMANSIINTMETEAAETSARNEAARDRRESSSHSSMASDRSYPDETEIHRLGLPSTLQDFPTQYDDPDVDSVLRDLFPELY